MTIRQLFREVFRETLAEHGFGYKYNYFYRLNGEMLQGVTVHIATGGGGYSIRLACYPYWMHNTINLSDRIRDLKKPYWVEHCEPSVGVICAHLDDETEYKACYEEMIKFILSEFPATPLAVVSTTAVLNTGQNNRVRARNKVANEIAKKYSLPFGDKLLTKT